VPKHVTNGEHNTHTHTHTNKQIKKFTTDLILSVPNGHNGFSWFHAPTLDQLLKTVV